MKNKRLLVIASHSSGSYGLALTEAYADAARLLGHDVRLLRLDQLRFDPILHLGYQVVQPLEPDLLSAQADLEWAQHVTVAYPIWWGSVPAILKGFLDRVLLPGFAFKYDEGKLFPTPLLSGKTGQLLVTMDTPPWYFRWVYWAPGLYQMKTTTLEFCGIKPVKSMMLGPVKGADQALRARWMEKVRKLAERV
jgi:NAD(P)H dehydrogenase (quinone)